VRTAEEMAEYVDFALAERAAGRALPFAIIDRATGRVVGSTRYGAIEPAHRRVEFHMASDKPGLVMRERLLEVFRAHGEEEVHL